MNLRKIKYILGITILLFGMFLIKPGKVEAASASISCGSSATVNSPITISVSGSAVQWNLKLKVNGAVIASSSEVENYTANKTISFSGKYTPTSEGTLNVSLEGTVTEFSDGSTIRSFGSKTITVVAASSGGNQGGGSTGNQGGSNSGTTTPTKDSNANLSNLGIRPNDFSGFKPWILTYTVNVPNDVSSIEVYAKAKSQKTTVSGTGKKTLKEGKNNFPVTVTAENGTKKTYTISVTRATIDEGEVPPNVIDEEEVPPIEEQPQGIGLATLEIEGYELDKEFATDVYEYKVMLDKEIILSDLEEIKESIKATANNENVVVEMTAEVTEDGKNLITIVVKDEEREYAKYIITFEEKEKEEQQEVLGLVSDTTNSDNGSGNTGLFGLTFEQQLFVVLGCFGITFLMALFFAYVSYAKSKRLAEFEEDEEFDEENNFEVEPMNGFYIGAEQNNIQEVQENADRINELETTENQNAGELVSDAASRLEKLNGYRSLRKGNRESGRHF